MLYVLFIVVVVLSMFGVDNFEEILNLKDMELIFEGLKYVKWNFFCELEDFCYFVLVMLCFMLCMFYGLEIMLVKVFNYEEEFGFNIENYLWGNVVFVMVMKFIDSFVKFCWCLNIIGL